MEQISEFPAEGIVDGIAKPLRNELSVHVSWQLSGQHTLVEHGRDIHTSMWIAGETQGGFTEVDSKRGGVPDIGGRGISD